jgi:hypothetical protein
MEKLIVLLALAAVAVMWFAFACKAGVQTRKTLLIGLGMLVPIVNY